MWDWGIFFAVIWVSCVLYMWRQSWQVKKEEDKVGVIEGAEPYIGPKTFKYTHAEGTKPHIKVEPKKPEPEKYTKEQFRLDYITCMGHLDIPPQVALIKINKLLVMRLLNVKLDHGEQAYWEDIRRLKGHGS